MRRACLIGAVVAVAVLRAAAQSTTPQPAPGPQPGLAWTPDQILKAAHHVRAGRRLTPKTWPNGARVAVCLSFDPDNQTIPLNAGINAPLTMSEGEYGAHSGVPRILKFLDAYNLPATFYVPAVAAVLHPDMMTAINRSGRHEVAMHGWIHEDPLALNDPEEEWRLLSQALATLEKVDGKRPVGNRNPSWTMSCTRWGSSSARACSTTAACRPWTNRTMSSSTASRPASSSCRSTGFWTMRRSSRRTPLCRRRG